MSPSLTERLGQTRSFLQRRRWLAGLVFGGIAAVVILLLFALLGLGVAFQERTAFGLIVAVFFLSAASLLIFSILVWRKPVPLPALAGEVEQRNPSWMDGLICATELEGKPAADRRVLEQALIEKMRRETADVDFTATLLPPLWRRRLLFGALGGFLALALLLVITPFFAKGRFYMRDLWNGSSSGMLVTPGNGEAPVRSDVRIEAEILRWEDQPVIEYIDRRGRQRYPMHRNTRGHSFNFYDISDPIRYRIVTPSLRSQWYQVTSYIPPSIDETEITVQPPAYTRLPEETYSDLRNITAIAGSSMRWRIESSGATAAIFQVESNEQAMQAAEAGIFTHALTATSSFTGRLLVQDAEGRSARTPPFQVEVSPDLPPTIEVTQPGRDTEAEPEARIDLRALAADDFGLTDVSLHVSISGRRQPQTLLFSSDGNEEQPILEEHIQSALDLAALEAQEGEVVTYFFTATDNREPDPQQARSEVFFIEVREPVVPLEMEGAPMELEQIDLQALIVEMKSLIRQSWVSLGRDDDRAERTIAAGLEEVRLEIARVQQEVLQQAGEEDGRPMADLLERAMQRMEEAVRHIGQGEIEPSIPFQEMALGDIVAIQTELMRNQTQSKEPSEGGSPSPSGGQQPEMAEDEQLEALQELMREVQRMADEQATQNSTLRRTASGSLSTEQQAELQRRQEALHQQAQQASQALQNASGLEGARRDLGSAGAQMEAAAAQIGQGLPDAAARDGDRARSSLLSALQRIEDAMGEAGGNQIAQLAHQAEQLAQQQGEAAGSSRGMGESGSPSSEEIASSREQQQALQSAFEALLGAMDQAAGQVRDGSPEAARAIAEAGQEMRDAGVAAQMGRAGNALLYRRFERAAEMQDQAAEQLHALSQSLEQSAGLLPSMSRQQMEQLLSQLRQAQQEAAGMTGESSSETGERLGQMSSRLSERIGRAGQALNNSTLQEISGELGAGNGEESRDPLRTADLLRAAARSLEQQLFSQEVDRRSRLQRQVSEPPEKYRGLVEEYFRSLSETP